MKLKFDERKLYIILFVIILLIAILVRTISWPTAISQVNSDEAMTALNAKSLAETGKDIYGTSFPVYLEAWGAMGQSVMLAYFMAFFIKLFGFSMISIRLPMLFISIISIIIFYDLVKRMSGNKKIAIVSMAFVSICPWHLLQSIWSLDCNMFPHFMLISVYLLYRGIEEKRWMIYISMLFFALTMYTYGVAVYVVPFFLLACAIYLLIKKDIKVKELIVCILIYLLFSSPILTMYVINALKIDTNIHIGKITIQYFAANSRTSDMLFFSDDLLHTLSDNLKCLVKTLFVQHDGLEWNGILMFGTVYHISLIFCIYEIVHLIRHKDHRNTATFIFTVWLILGILLGIIINGCNINRLNIVWFPILFFSVMGICQLCMDKKILRFIIGAIYLVLFVGFISYLYSSYVNKIDMSGCFAQGSISAVHYATSDLDKQVVYYCNVESIYVRFQDAIDGTKSENIQDLNKFEERLQNKKENEAFLINNNELLSSGIDLYNYNYQKFGHTYVIY